MPWQKELYGFGWLRHLHAAEDQIAREKARKLVLDWIALRRSAPPVAHDPDTVAKRVIALLSHAAFLLDGADPDFYDAAMRLLSDDVHDLTVIYGDASGVAKLRALTAILLAGLCVAEQESYLTSYQSVFCGELERQILEDGGPVSRDPADLIELLLELLPLKQCFVARQLEPPDALYTAINTMNPMLRFLRLGDGSVAHFNGMGPTLLDQVATVLAYDDVGGLYKGVLADQSGYARLAAGETVVIADAGGAPPIHLSDRAHAGCASFEMSSGHRPSSPIAVRLWTRPGIGTSSRAPLLHIRRCLSRICHPRGSSRRRRMSPAASCSGFRVRHMSATRFPRTKPS